MMYVAFAALLLAAITALTFGTVVTSLLRTHARERNLMLNQLLHLAGRTWEPPPVEPTENGFDPDADVDDRFTTSPTQMPDL